MRQRPSWLARAVPMMFLCFAAGAVIGWELRGHPPVPAGVRPKPDATSDAAAIADIDRPGPTISATPSIAASSSTPAPSSPPAPSSLRPTSPTGTSGSTDNGTPSGLRLPIDGVTLDSLKGQFSERRTDHPHDAVDLLAPRNTPVHAVADGTIAKLFVSKAGGNTIYQFDPSGRLCFYYAHLQRYADPIAEGQHVSRGDVIGFVGTSGNAPPNTPHLHFAVFELGSDRRWWQGKALDPYKVFGGNS